MTASLRASALSGLEHPDVVGIPVVVSGDGELVLPEGLPDRIAGAAVPASLDVAWAKVQGFDAKPGQSLVLRSVGGPTVAFLGVGGADKVDADTWRRLGAAAVRASAKASGIAVVIPAAATLPAVDVARAVGVGALLAAYRPAATKSTDDARSVDIALTAVDEETAGQLDAAARQATVTATAVCWARDLVNRPAAQLTPSMFATEAADRLADAPHTSVEVWEESRIADERLGGLLGVSFGSLEPPRLVVATYEPEGATGHVVLVGKGITFDSGGLSLKPAASMIGMKYDMTGAAVVLGALLAAAQLGARVKVTAIAPLTENLPGNRATKPGDVLTARNGTTIEVLNTDAEGRLVLADGLSLAAEMAPDAIIDVATLTGAVRAALGSDVAAIFGTSATLVADLRSHGDDEGERLWELPLVESYASHLDSDVADLKNIGKTGNAGSITAALFLRRFAGDVPWAHLDIASTGNAESDDGYVVKGATAFSLRTILAYLLSR